MKVTTDLTTYEDIYDAVQMGEIEAKMGDVINGQYLMVNGYHLVPLPEDAATRPFFIFTEVIHNKSTGNTFTEQYVAQEACPIHARYTHLETQSVTSEPIDIA